MKIVMLGSGNVATHLGKALQKAGHTINQVWSRQTSNAEILAQQLNAQVLSDIGNADLSADLYILAVRDDGIFETASQLPLENQLVVHTSGSTDIGVLSGVSTQFGVIYPVQTFSKQRQLDFANIPVMIEGSSPEVTRDLAFLAGGISGSVFELDSEKRKALHIAAVFACNFANHLYNISEKILAEHGIDFKVLAPMIAETADKVQKNSPYLVQTGPAVRNDLETIEKHLHYLKNNHDLLDLYKKLSQGIIELHKKR